MKTYYSILYIVFGISIFLFSSCNTVKYVADNDHLLTENTIIVNGKKSVDDDLYSYIIQRPNSLTLGVPVALNFYNWGDKGLENEYLKAIDTFSRKRDYPKKYKKFKYKYNHWKFKNGEAPVILDSTKTKLTANELKKHYASQGYFRAKINHKEFRKNNKRATVQYKVNTGKVYFIDSIYKKIKSPILDSIFKLHKNKSIIKSKEKYNDLNFENEADRITSLFRNSGVYHFTRGAIGYKADSSKNLVSVQLNIADRIIEKNDTIISTPYTIQKISKVDVYTDYSFNNKDEPYLEKESYKGINFYAHNVLKYNSKLLSNAIFIEPNSIYKDIDKDLTRKNLRELQNFKVVNVKYEEIDSENLAAKIYLTPYKKRFFKSGLELTHSNIKQLGVSGEISTLNRNTFRGSEILRFSIQGSFFNTARDASDNSGGFFNAFEFGGDVTLELPRILFPTKTEKLISKKMSPKTKISIGTSFQKNIGLDKQKFTAIIGYNWTSNKNKKHRVELVNAQYIRNLNTESYFNIYQSEYNSLTSVSNIIAQTSTIPSNNFDTNGNIIPSNFINYITDTSNGFKTTNLSEFNNVQNIEKRQDIITEDALVPVVSYEYTYDNSKNYKDANFSFFRARIASSGALSSNITTKKNTNGRKEILGIPIAQYLKTDFEYKKFWGTSSDNVLAFRSLLGIAIPYGNSKEVPFSRSYFIGGANDLRAWKIYDIGPGSIQNGLEYNVGTLKFLSSLEYRFKIINSVKGALFLDAGNIWDITKTELIAPKGKFNGFKSLDQIAIGTGFGIRYDFNFLVIRLDLGFKTYEPYQPNNLKWLSNYNFNNAVYNIGINYPF